ncbi:sulfite exporter TauE/SafE family protein [Dyella solisilvae]|uniref:Sulfite exporter TauE/SafE family protein n=1 Tax=Dyella solisilvae TaxID=1920168 RepID=A0A370K713_9GAMM|nr:sulfite exporter TauE/SafE family protein [Dyella solisilvae]RDI98412.1 sulfite exporter TauE/SafE family protein [Dyella solisilvae]
MQVDVLALSAVLLTGLLGGVHCAAMCGGIATGFSMWSPRAGWGAALQLNLGRVGGYVLAGAIVGGIGGGVLHFLELPGLAVTMRALVGMVLVVVALRLLDHRGRLAWIARPGARVWRWLQPLQRRLLPANTPWRRLAAGMLWGWLPCGLSTTVLAAAWLQASAWHGALTMAVFGSGTLPVMLPLTWSGARMGRWLQQPGPRRGAALLVLGAGVLTLAAPWLMHWPVMHGLLGMMGCGPVAR